MRTRARRKKEFSLTHCLGLQLENQWFAVFGRKLRRITVLLDNRKLAEKFADISVVSATGYILESMRRPDRTRRLSIAAMASLLALVAVSGASVRSFQTWDNLRLGPYRAMILNDGCIVYAHYSANSVYHSPIFDHHSTIVEENFTLGTEFPAYWSIAGFWGGHIKGNRIDEAYFGVPLWPLLLLLLIMPVGWLIARPMNAAAFPVISDVSQGQT